MPKTLAKKKPYDFGPNLRPVLKKLLDKDGNITREFCQKFIELLPEEGDESGWEEGNDSGDYSAWGYALYKDLEEAEDAGHAVWEAVEIFKL